MVPTIDSDRRSPIEAVVFDWYATLGRPLDDGWWGQIRRSIADAGGTVDESAVLAWQMMPTDHRAWSGSREVYREWGRARFRELVATCGVPPGQIDALVDESEQVRSEEVIPVLQGAVSAIGTLREAGLRVALCSNWDWDLERHLVANSLDEAFDVVVCSAIAGYRKPHPAIFDLVLDRLDLDPARVIFVGDDLDADIAGAGAVGLTPVHAAWALPCAGEHSDEIICCSSFDELLTHPAFGGRFDPERSAPRP